MKTFTAALAINATLFVHQTAHANYTGLQVERQRVTLQDGTLMNQFRVYAMFSDPNDSLTAVSGSPTLGNFMLQSRNSDDTAIGGVFYNPPGGGIRAPSAAAIAINPDVAYDTFVTIGVSIADQAPVGDQTSYAANFAGIGSVAQINSNNFGWFSGRQNQAKAGFLGDGDPLLRVLCMQLTVSSTSNVRGTVAISGVNNLPSPVAFTIAGQTFNSIPGPSSFVVALLGITRRSRRRR
jgi:hypothetical protein